MENIDSIDENKTGIVVQSALENNEDDDEFGDFEKFTKAVHIRLYYKIIREQFTCVPFEFQNFLV